LVNDLIYVARILFGNCSTGEKYAWQSCNSQFPILILHSSFPIPHSPKAVVDFNPFSGHYHQPLFSVAIINARINDPR
jgi:hypothetical protein